MINNGKENSQERNVQDDIDTNGLLKVFFHIDKDIYEDLVQAANKMAFSLNMSVKYAALELGRIFCCFYREQPDEAIYSIARFKIFFSEEENAEIKKKYNSGDKLGAQKIILKKVQQQYH
jgi:hypothetical protein